MGRRASNDRPAIHRDADGDARIAPDWESLAERLIREAQEAGAFSDLPGHGAPLRLEDDGFAGEMASANRMLRNAGAAPPWIETDKAARDALLAIDRLIERGRHSGPSARSRLDRELEALMDAYDEAAVRLESLAPTPRQQRSRLDREPLRTRLTRALDGAG